MYTLVTNLVFHTTTPTLSQFNFFMEQGGEVGSEILYKASYGIIQLSKNELTIITVQVLTGVDSLFTVYAPVSG